MGFCKNCGVDVPDYAHYCLNCGKPTEKFKSNEQTSRQQEYAGKIIKCPNCGEVLKSMTAICPSCGHELRGIDNSNAVCEFANKLEKSQSSQGKINIIRNFPIPNTKEDIFEFMFLASSNINGELDKSVFKAWVAKFEQAYQKAKLVIKDSSDVAHFESIYKKTHKQITKEKFLGHFPSKNLLKKIFLLAVKNAAVIAGIVLLILAICVDKNGGIAIIYELIGVILLVISAGTLLKRDTSYLEILISAGSGGISFLFANFLYNGVMLQLGGVIVLIIVAISFFKKLSKTEK